MRRSYLLPKASDINAGFLVALVGIPQCLAYAMLSGLPPMYGLVTAAIPGMIAALFGRSAGVTVGPTNTTGLIILTSLSPWAGQPELLLTAMATLAFLAGVARLIIVLVRGERIFDFVPEAVMVGFATGAAIIIALMQIDELLGAPFRHVDNVIDELRQLVFYPWGSLSFSSLGLGLVALISVVIGKRFYPKLPIPLVVLLISILLVWFQLTPFSQHWVTLGDSTFIEDGWPSINKILPTWSMFQALIVPGFAVAFIGSLELIVTLRNRNEPHLLRSELRSQGLANIAGSITGSFPASTSLTRSVLLDIGGANSRWAPFLAALIVVPIVLFGAQAIRAIPQPVISGLLIATAISMLKPKGIRQMISGNSQTRTLFLITLGSTLILNFHEAILLGTALGIVLFLFQASQTNIEVYDVHPDGQLSPMREDVPASHQLIQISGSLYFAAARQLPDRLAPCLRPETELVTLDLSHAHHCRVAAIQALLTIAEHCSFRDIRFEITGASPSLKALAHNMGVRLPWSTKTIRLSLSAEVDTL